MAAGGRVVLLAVGWLRGWLTGWSTSNDRRGVAGHGGGTAGRGSRDSGGTENGEEAEG